MSACRCTIIEVGARRWCVTAYARGGCGGYWYRRGARWVLGYRGHLGERTDLPPEVSR